MRGSFVVPPADQLPRRRSKSGSIGDRLCLPIARGGNGKSFIIASVAPPGGPGVAIAPRANLPHQSLIRPNRFGG